MFNLIGKWTSIPTTKKPIFLPICQISVQAQHHVSSPFNFNYVEFIFINRLLNTFRSNLFSFQGDHACTHPVKFHSYIYTMITSILVCRRSSTKLTLVLVKVLLVVLTFNKVVLFLSMASTSLIHFSLTLTFPCGWICCAIIPFQKKMHVVGTKLGPRTNGIVDP